MKKFIRGHIKKIINEYSLVLDVTAADGVEEGMIFIIYEEGEQIRSDDGVSLGRIEYPKATVKIINSSSRFSIAESDEWYYEEPPWDYPDEPPDYDPDEEFYRQRKML